MLRSFRVANHRSIRDEQELVLLPAYDKQRPAVPVAAVFGANASGKSNLLDALAFMQSAVRGSFGNWEAGSGVPRTSFKLDPKFASQPSVYAVDLLLDGTQFEYGFTVDSRRVLSEWLYSYPHRRKRVIFERERDSILFGSTVPDYRGRSELMEDLTRDNALVLSSAAQANQDAVAPVHEWFRQLLWVGSHQIQPPLAGRVLKVLDQRPGFLELVRSADLGITDLSVRRPDIAWPERTGDVDPSWPSAEESWLMRVGEILHGQSGRLVFHHGRDGVAFGVEDESKGTLAWLRLLLDCVDALDNGGLMVVDEVDSSLHPHLTSTLINLFRDEQTNTRNAQLVFTTHDATLLDDEILSRDQIWFVEKDPDEGTTRLYPLTDFHPRKNENTQGRYLAGSYGAVPVLAEHRMRRAIRSRAGKDAAA